MKKKNLNFLLIALAAMALVFAGACSDGSDDDGSSADNNSSGNPTDVTSTYTSEFSDTTWTYNASASKPESGNDGTYLGKVTLAFAETGRSVSGTAQWWVRSGSGNTTTEYSGTFSGTYSDWSYDETNGLTVTVTLGSVSLPLTLSDSAYTTSDNVATIKDKSEWSGAKLSVANGFNSGSNAKFEVSATSNSEITVDIFSGDVDSAIAAAADFEYDAGE